MLNCVKIYYLVLHSSQALHNFAASNLIKADKLMNVENTKSQMRKGMLEYCIMLVLHRRSSYANEIIALLKAADMIVVEGTLYPLLTRLKNDGLLRYEWRESMQGPPRKYYTLTEDGEDALAQLDDSWQEIANTVGILQNEQRLLGNSED